jgi:putative endonuclease
MPKVFTSQSQRTGELGEQIATKYLLRKGYSIIERNYTKKWGEIDIVAQKGGIVYFFEVKSKNNYSEYRPEENMHSGKIVRLKRTLQTYLLERCYEGEWQFGLITVYLDSVSRTAQVRLLENVIL